MRSVDRFHAISIGEKFLTTPETDEFDGQHKKDGGKSRGTIWDGAFIQKFRDGVCP